MWITATVSRPSHAIHTWIVSAGSALAKDESTTSSSGTSSEGQRATNQDVKVHPKGSSVTSFATKPLRRPPLALPVVFPLRVVESGLGGFSFLACPGAPSALPWSGAASVLWPSVCAVPLFLRGCRCVLCFCPVFACLGRSGGPSLAGFLRFGGIEFS